MTRAELEDEWGVSTKTADNRIKKLYRAGRIGVCKKPGHTRTGVAMMFPAYYPIGDSEDDN